MYILVVEDDHDLQAALVDLLVDHGYEVRGAANGLEALKLARAEPPTLIITDMMMPAMGGGEFLRELEADPTLRSVPRFLLTAAHDLSSSAEPRVPVFVKPLRMEELLRAVATYVTPRPSAH